MRFTLTLIALAFLAPNIVAQTNKKGVDDYIMQNLKKSKTYKTQLVGKFLECKFDEVYFVEGFDKNKKLAERFVVFNENGAFAKSSGLIFWGAYKHPVLYYHSSDTLESSSDIEDLKITCYKGKFTFTNKPLQKQNAEKLQRIKKGEDPEKNIVEASGAGVLNFEDYLTENECKK